MGIGKPDNEVLADILSGSAGKSSPGKDEKWSNGGVFAGGRVRREVSGNNRRVIMELPEGRGKLTLLSRVGDYGQDVPISMVHERGGVVRTAKFVVTNAAHQDYQIENSDGSSAGNVFLQGAGRSEMSMRVAKGLYSEDPCLSKVDGSCGPASVYFWVEK
jgi:hypothetical protein